MSVSKRLRRKDGDTIPFVRLPRYMVLEDPEWRGLPPAAKLFYLHLKAKYNGHNNGEIQLTYPELKGNNGLSAPDTISKAQIELIEKEWIVKTGNGGLMKNPNKFELTWKIDCLR